MGNRSSWLTVDQGNTSLSVVWSTLEAEFVVRGIWACGDLGELAQVRADLRGQLDSLAGVYCSSVRGQQAVTELLACLKQHFGSVCSPGHGLELETAGNTGCDRLYAARAADELSGGGPVVIVDVGTAMTVDLVRDGVFKGGAIAPGPRLLARVMGLCGAQLFEIEPRREVSALGRDTRGALEAGVTIGLRGSARALVEELVHEAARGECLEVFVTGGARGLLLGSPTFLPGRELTEVPLLVHLGLLFCAGHLRGQFDLGQALLTRHRLTLE